MQRDMHFYAVYALARAAGVKDTVAHTIACASQFVDDATDDDVVSIQDKTVLATMTSHKSLDFKNAIPGDQWRVWVPFHFLPGNDPKDGSFYQRMTCRKNSEPAQKMKDFALDPKNKEYWPHLIGITAHVYADTFSHFGFTGYACDGNKVKEYTIRITGEGGKNILRFIGKLAKSAGTAAAGLIAEQIPVGHGAVGIFPDHPSISWTFEYEGGSHDAADTNRDNHSNFIEGCKCLYEFFKAYLKGQPQDKESGNSKTWETIVPVVSSIIQGGSSVSLAEREHRWKNAILAGTFCSVTQQDAQVNYIENSWDLENCSKLDNAETVDHARAFIRAAFLHRDYVLHELLPELGLITY